MLYHLLYGLHDQAGWLSGLNVLRYTSTRILLATLTGLLLTLLLYPWFIRTLQRIQLGQVVRDDGPESHFSKRGTPTMGGSLIIFAVIIPTVLWSDLGQSAAELKDVDRVRRACRELSRLDAEMAKPLRRRLRTLRQERRAAAGAYRARPPGGP